MVSAGGRKIIRTSMVSHSPKIAQHHRKMAHPQPSSYRTRFCPLHMNNRRPPRGTGRLQRPTQSAAAWFASLPEDQVLSVVGFKRICFF
jgi:hypothetical protein